MAGDVFPLTIAAKTDERAMQNVKTNEITMFDRNKSLFERVHSMDQLASAFKAVKRNKGSPGIDGLTIEQFEENLNEELGKLSDELQSWTYRPNPVRRVEISKPNGGTRLLGVPCIRDRVVQASLKAVLEPILDPKFSPNSYGFRPGRNQKMAVEAAQEIVQGGKEYVVDIDLSKFFDRINHDRLVHRLSLFVSDKRILRLIGMTLRSGVMVKGVAYRSDEGSVQGSPLSPLLSNLVLDELDRELERRDLEFCRFADDCNIFTRTEKAANRVMTSVSKFIEKKLKLVVNREKSKVARSSMVKFLGMTIVSGTLAISPESMARAMTKVKELTPRGSHLSIENTIERVNSWYVGWANYYKMTEYPSQFATVEGRVRRRLRSRIIGEHKRKRFLVTKLVKRGVKRHSARKLVYSNKGRWAMSHGLVMSKAYPVKWFTETLAQKTFSDKRLSHWYDVSVWIKLT